MNKKNASKIFMLILLWMTSQDFLYGQVDERFSINSTVDSISFVKGKSSKTTDIIGITVPAAMVTYGLISLGDNAIRQIDYNAYNSLENNDRFWSIKIDDYVQFAPMVAAYALKLGKVESANNLLDMTILCGLSSILALGTLHGTKIVTKRIRPDNADDRSFPSGHTGFAFAAAEFLHQEYKDKSIWISIGGYTAATFVAFSRVYRNKHWVSDVVAGAGIGILSTKAVYWAYPYLQKAFGEKDKSLNTFIFPEYSNGNLGLALSHTF